MALSCTARIASAVLAAALLAALPGSASARPKPAPQPTAVVDASGIALGHWRNRPTDSGKSWTQRQQAAEVQFGPFEGHWRNYKPANSAGTLNSAETAALVAGKKLFVNWKPCSSWSAAAAGTCDAAITTAATDWASKCTAPDQCWITFWHEPEDDLGGSNTIPTYQAMFRHVATVWRQSAPDVPIVWTMMGFSGHRSKYPGLWPGAEYVDIIGHDPYIKGSTTPANLASTIIDDATWLRANLPGAADKPVVAAEYGAGLSSSGANPAHHAAAYQSITDRLDEVRASGHVELDLFDQTDNRITCADLSCADAQAYKRLKDATEA